MAHEPKLMRLEPKKMFLARRVGDDPIQIYETIQYLDTKERVWDTSPDAWHVHARCAIGFTEESARNLLIWGPFVQGSSNGRTRGFEPQNAGSSPAP